MPVCVFGDGRTHGHMHNPILSGIRCFLRRRNARARNNDAYSQIIVLICFCIVCALRTICVDYVRSEGTILGVHGEVLTPECVRILSRTVEPYTGEVQIVDDVLSS